MFPRRLAIVHYHLRPGGVTRVIANTLAQLADESLQVVVLTGAPPPEGFGGKAVQVEGLGYDTDAAVDPAILLGRLRLAARAALGGPPDLWHIHNHSLGKNPAFTRAVGTLAEQGESLLLQVHDFAEDNRPRNFSRLLKTVADGDVAALGPILYPVSPRVHYAVLNNRDLQFLRQAGIPEGCTHLLPNPISLSSAPATRGGRPESVEGRLFLYPTRALRRKNVGEFLLWASLGQPGDRFAMTLEPTDPADLAHYRRWRELAVRAKWPVSFGVGLDGSRAFGDWIRESTAIMTTSVAEGFGLAYLEPYLMARPVVGRDLPEITSDFKASGLELDHLYTGLPVPVEWVGAARLRAALRSSMAAAWEACGVPLQPEAAESGIESLLAGGQVDFGRLDEAFQGEILGRFGGSSELKSRVGSLPQPASPSSTGRNARRVAEVYGPEAFGRRLEEAYGRVLEGTGDAGQTVSENLLLKLFMAPGRFHMLRS